ncbi:hypothetical protein FKW77_006521 [Venturia effusa]|uniref:Uncharacterized protein n=1 Tax=Venturia effusa TaxID=50376 RepID=A0A517LHD9_9PEZI|nr:hypothetical protein FKW77_006521 [Venturia effusa]
MTPYSRSSHGQSVNKDDMDMEMTSPTAKNFIDSLIQEINGTPIPPSPSTFDFSATDLSRQRQSSISDPSRIWSGPSTSPLEFPVHDEKSVTPEQERAAIARYRRERFPLPEHEWWKLESKHRVALAALRRMEEDQSRESSQDESHGQGHREPSYFRRNGDEGVVSGLKPEVLEALAFSHSPNPETVKPVGENGLDIKNPAQFSHALIRPPDCNPEAWEHWQHLEDVTDLQRHAWFGARLSAYSFEKGDIFDLRHTRVQQRLRRTEECWQHGRAAMNIETQFWNAVTSGRTKEMHSHSAIRICFKRMQSNSRQKSSFITVPSEKYTSKSSTATCSRLSIVRKKTRGTRVSISVIWQLPF